MEKNLFQWVFSSVAFWILGFAYSLWSGFGLLKSRMIFDFLATSAAAFLIIFVLYAVVYIVLYLRDLSKKKERAIEDLSETIRKVNQELKKK